MNARIDERSRRRHADRETLSAWLDGALPETTRRDLEEHLRRCAACRDRAEEFRGVTLALRRLGAAGVDLEARSRVRLALRGRLLAEARPSLLDAVVETVRPWFGGLVTAALAFVLFGFGFAGAGRLRAAEIQRGVWERELELQRFEAFLAADGVADGQWIEGVWVDPGLDARRPARRLRADSAEARRWLAARPEAAKALLLPGVLGVRLRAGSEAIEIDPSNARSSLGPIGAR